MPQESTQCPLPLPSTSSLLPPLLHLFVSLPLLHVLSLLRHQSTSPPFLHTWTHSAALDSLHGGTYCLIDMAPASNAQPPSINNNALSTDPQSRPFLPSERSLSPSLVDSSSESDSVAGSEKAHAVDSRWLKEARPLKTRSKWRDSTISWDLIVTMLPVIFIRMSSLPLTLPLSDNQWKSTGIPLVNIM